MHQTKNKQVLLFRLSAMGDVVMMSAVAQAISRYCPDITLTWAIDPVWLPLLAASLPHIHWLPINKPRQIRQWWHLARQLRQRPRFDLCLAAQASLRANCIYPMIRSQHTLGFDAARARDGHRWVIDASIDSGTEHLLEGFMRFAYAAGVPQDATIDTQLTPDPASQAWVQQRLSRPYWVLHPMASKPERCWSIDRYQQLIDTMLSQYPWDCVITGGASPKEQQYCAPLKRIGAQNPRVHYLVGQTSLTQCAALIDQASLCVAPDTGAVHLANAFNTPVVGLYAVVPASHSGPYHFQHLAVDIYPQLYQQIVAQGKSLTFGQRIHHPQAMQLIELPMVMSKIKEAHENYHP